METLFRVDPSLTGKELSTRLGLSVSRLARVFKRDAGVSIVEYRNRIRFRKFFELLGDRHATRTTLRQAARAAGFGSYAHFHRLFRARWQVCPREYFQNQAIVPGLPAPSELRGLAVRRATPG